MIFFTRASVAIGQTPIYKDIHLGLEWDDLISLPNFSECIEYGLKIACDDNHNFLGTTGILQVLFENDYAVRVIYSTENLSLFQNATNFFPQRGFQLGVLETQAGTIDFISLVREVGVEDAVARLIEAETSGLNMGFVSYVFLQSDMSGLLQFPNVAEALHGIPAGRRVVTIGVEETLLGAEAYLVFEPSLQSFVGIRRDLMIEEDF
jgi:hypothetical protein